MYEGYGAVGLFEATVYKPRYTGTGNTIEQYVWPRWGPTLESGDARSPHLHCLRHTTTSVPLFAQCPLPTEVAESCLSADDCFEQMLNLFVCEPAEPSFAATRMRMIIACQQMRTPCYLLSLQEFFIICRIRIVPRLGWSQILERCLSIPSGRVCQECLPS